MSRKEDLKEIIKDNGKTLLVSEIDLEFYKEKLEKVEAKKVKKKSAKEAKEALVQDIKNNIERVESKIETLEKWLKIAKKKLRAEK